MLGWQESAFKTHFAQNLVLLLRDSRMRGPTVVISPRNIPEHRFVGTTWSISIGHLARQDSGIWV